MNPYIHDTFPKHYAPPPLIRGEYHRTATAVQIRSSRHTPSVLNICYILLFTSILTICFIKKIKIMKNQIYTKLLYVINYIIFIFFYNFNFLNKTNSQS
jgi:hypothetical protein